MIKQVQLQGIVNEFQAHYNLQQWEVVNILELAIRETVSRRFGSYCEVQVDSETFDLDVVLFKDPLFREASPISPRKIRGLKEITRNLNRKAQFLSLKQEKKKNELRINSLCKGAITGIGDNETFLV